jgi:DNA polymerase-3 subunit gamma/tau
MGSAAPAVAELAPEPRAADNSSNGPSLDSLRQAVLNSLGSQPVLASMLESAEWGLEGNSLVVKVAGSATIIEMSFNMDARRIAAAAASGTAGRPIKLQVLPGGTQQPVSTARRPASNGTARGRAEQDPVVQRMQEKFGAEIRTVIDYRDKQ